MGVQPGQFLVDVDPVGVKGHFVQQSGLVHLHPVQDLADPRLQAGAQILGHLRGPGPDAIHQGADGRKARGQVGAQGPALVLPHPVQGGRGLGQRPVQQGGQLLGVLLRGGRADDLGQAEEA